MPSWFQLISGQQPSSKWQPGTETWAARKQMEAGMWQKLTCLDTCRTIWIHMDPVYYPFEHVLYVLE